MRGSSERSPHGEARRAVFFFNNWDVDFLKVPFEKIVISNELLKYFLIFWINDGSRLKPAIISISENSTFRNKRLNL